jgi:hypothetical protein
MINNLNIIKPLLNFENDGDFYMLYIFKRKKDQDEGEKDNHQSVRTIKTYCVSSINYLEKRYPEIIQLCEIFKARAYIHVQKQNHKDISISMMVELAQRIQNGVTNQFGIFESVVGQLKTYEKRWVVDIDLKDFDYVLNVSNFINKLRPEGDKVEAVLPTKDGFHLITKRVDVLEFLKKYPMITIQKKNPTLLYYPSGGSNPVLTANAP